MNESFYQNFIGQLGKCSNRLWQVTRVITLLTVLVLTNRDFSLCQLDIDFWSRYVKPTRLQCERVINVQLKCRYREHVCLNIETYIKIHMYTQVCVHYLLTYIELISNVIVEYDSYHSRSTVSKAFIVFAFCRLKGVSLYRN